MPDIEEESKFNNSKNNDSSSSYVQVHSVTTSGKDLLSSMKIDFPEGQITAILGPSGSGKTTLLNFVSGTITGNLIANGEVHLSGRQGFVPQQDSLHGFFTCRKYMRHYTRLSGIEDDALSQENSMSLLSDLGLDRHADTIVGDLFRKGLSGGQQRRLSVALEALSGPETLFLDEPTSGLDSESAFQVMKFLRGYARSSSRRVILTIHQPSSFIWEMLDNIVLLSKGQLIYQGQRYGIEPFFASQGCACKPNYNPADHYVEEVNDEFQLHHMSAQEWATAFKNYNRSSSHEDSENKEETETERVQGLPIALASEKESIFSIENRSIIRRSESLIVTMYSQSSRANSFVATKELTHRYLLNLWLNPGILGTRLAMYSILSLIIGVLFFDLGSNDSYSSAISRLGVLFYCVSFFIFMSVAVLPFTVLERAIVEKEVRNEYYHPACFQVAQAIASIPGIFALALTCSAIVVGMTGLRSPYWYFLNMFLSLNCSEALAHLVSHLVPHFIIGIAIIAGIYGMFMLLCGFFIIPSEFPGWLGWSYHVAIHTYSWRSFMYGEFHGDDVTFDSEQFPTGNSILKLYEIEDVNRAHDMIILLCYALGVHCISLVVLHVKHIMYRRHQAQG